MCVEERVHLYVCVCVYERLCVYVLKGCVVWPKKHKRSFFASTIILLLRGNDKLVVSSLKSAPSSHHSFYFLN